MAGEPPPAAAASERERRAFLEQAARALAASSVPDLTWVYRATPLSPAAPVVPDAPRTILVASLPGVAGEVRIAAVTAVRRLVIRAWLPSSRARARTRQNTPSRSAFCHSALARHARQPPQLIWR